MSYLATNLTNKKLSIADIPNVGVIYIDPNATLDLELYATRNQILDSAHLKLHIAESRISITASPSPDERIYVDAYISSGAISINQDVSPWLISGNVVATTNQAGLDAFARQRISQPFTLNDYKHLYGLDPNFIDLTSNGATISFQANQACARLQTTSNSSSSAIHQTKMYHHYMPGKSQLILSSFCFYNPTVNVTKRTGYFDGYNGIYLEQRGDGVLAFVIRSDVSGTPTETRISQFGGVYGAEDIGWADPCDGSGPSGFNLLVDKTQLLSIDFQWLGVGRIRMGFAHNGDYIQACQFNGTNHLSTVYMSNPNLPVRCEIFNTGDTSGGYFDQICSTVVSEGGYVESGQDWALLSPSFRTLATSGATQTLPVLAIRLKNTFNGYPNRMLARLGEVFVFSESGNVEYQIVKLPGSANLTGGAGTWTPVNGNSGIEYRADATGYSSSEVLGVGFSASATQGGNKAGSNAGASAPSTAKKNFIAQNLSSTNSEIYAIIVKNIDSKETRVMVGLQWREIY